MSGTGSTSESKPVDPLQQKVDTLTPPPTPYLASFPSHSEFYDRDEASNTDDDDESRSPPGPGARAHSARDFDRLFRHPSDREFLEFFRPPSFSDLTAAPQPPTQPLETTGEKFFFCEEPGSLATTVPLYKACIICDWKAAESILLENPELVKSRVTENLDTALHVAASIEGSKHVDKFVNNLMNLMADEDLELLNKNNNTALYSAIATGNVKTVRIMVQKYRKLVTIPCTKEKVMPLYVAALYGNYEMVEYLYENSKELCDEDGWKDNNRCWLLEKCVESDIFGVALKMVQKYPHLGSRVLTILARKPNAFSNKKANIMKNGIIQSVLALIHTKVHGDSDKKNEAWQLLETILKDNSSRESIIEILRVSSDDHKINQLEDTVISGNVIQALQLKKLMYEHVDKLHENIKRSSSITDSVKLDQALHLEKLIVQHLVNMHEGTQNLIKLDAKSDEARKLQNCISKYIFDMHVETEKIMRKESHDEDRALELQKLIDNSTRSVIAEVNTPVIHTPVIKDAYSPRVLFTAAEMGNTIFIVELIRQYPDLTWKVNDNRQSVFHIAVKHRYEGIYNLLYEIGSMKDSITSSKDEDGNNMLHLAGKMPVKERLADVSGAALKMQKELLWFKEVRSMIPPSYRERRNKYGQTPHEVFKEDHKELIKEAEEWMKGTASQCMVVAALIATIVFAAAFTVPGGYDQNNGIPIFHSKATFVVFVVMDALSLFLSTASILTFLSLLTSRYAERDFLKSLPNKLMLGVVTLFLSITTMMVTFSVSFFILYHKQMKWIPISISICAVSPVLLYVVLQFHLLIDVLRSAHGSKHLFKPDRRVLYLANPVV